MSKIIVKVPATSANLGPGFDTLGIALNIFNKFIFERKDQFEFINVLEKYANENNMIVRSAIETYKYMNCEVIPFSLEEDQDIPISRGLGSSATCIVAGIVAANYFAVKVYGKVGLDKKDILKIATSIEGHPDNVAPAIYGGLISSFIDNQNVEITRYKVSENLLFTACIPNFSLSTAKSRNVLPKKLFYSDIVYSLSRAINIPKAIEEGDVKKLYLLLNDKLHHPYRLPLINESLRFRDFSKKNKIPFCISGSGSTLMFISNRDVESNLNKMKLKNKWEFKTLKPNLTGVVMEVLDEE